MAQKRGLLELASAVLLAFIGVAGMFIVSLLGGGKIALFGSLFAAIVGVSFIVAELVLQRAQS